MKTVNKSSTKLKYHHICYVIDVINTTVAATTASGNMGVTTDNTPISTETGLTTTEDATMGVSSVSGREIPVTTSGKLLHNSLVTTLKTSLNKPEYVTNSEVTLSRNLEITSDNPYTSNEKRSLRVLPDSSVYKFKGSWNDPTEADGANGIGACSLCVILSCGIIIVIMDIGTIRRTRRRRHRHRGFHGNCSRQRSVFVSHK